MTVSMTGLCKSRAGDAECSGTGEDCYVFHNIDFIGGPMNGG
jgi:hypothetical protein